MADKIKILIVDDEFKIVDVVKSYLDAEGYETFCAGTGCEAIDLFNRKKPDLIVLDLMLPDLSGEDVCKVIRRSSDVPVIMLTAKASEENILSGLDLGADDYVTKPFSPRQLTARVKAILRRHRKPEETVNGSKAFNDGVLEINPITYCVALLGKTISLTPNEFKILSVMASFSQKVFSREELISQALGDEFEGYDRVVDTHIKNIRQKLEKDPKHPKYIITVHGFGYKFNDNGNDYSFHRRDT